MLHSYDSLPTPELGLDRKQLKIVKQNFLQVNQGRLDRALASLSDRQRHFITSLPVFFHTNHPMLPGFVTRTTPKGVANFTPSTQSVKQAQQFAHSFTYHKRGDEQLDIEALFLMGSSGTIAQSAESDFDVWVCHQSNLDVKQRSELQKRCDRLTAYADSIQIEVNFFLMDAEQFRQGNNGKLSTEDCGSSQHILLLDEFYRTALLLAGKMPIWWLVPQEASSNYKDFSETLILKRYIPNNITLDFGDVKQIPTGEFIGAGIWQLYKGIHNPYKSVLKLAGIEAYASEHPKTISLSECYKATIYQNQLNIDELDPYIMLYRKIEQYLKDKNDTSRLELVRHCFYLKVDIKLSRYLKQSATHTQLNWRINALLQLTQEWGWDSHKIQRLDERNNWKIQQVEDERNALVSALMHSYRFLSGFAKRHEEQGGENNPQINKQELVVLGRKLYAAFERRAGKVEKINLGISQQVNEDIITFQQQDTIWRLYHGGSQQNTLFKKQALKQGPSLTGLLAWACVNGVINHGTQMNVESQSLSLTIDELDTLKKNLLRHLNHSALSIDRCGKAFETSVKPKTKLILVNLGLAPMPKLQEQGIHRLSSHADALSYGGLKENLIHSIDEIDINSWHEVTTARFNGDTCLLDCLENQLKTIPPDQFEPPNIHVFCVSPSHANTIINRVKGIFKHLHEQCYLGMDSAFSRFVFMQKKRYALIQYQGKTGVKKHIAKDTDELFSLLASPQHQFSPIKIDPLCSNDNILDHIAEVNQANTIQVLIFENKDSTIKEDNQYSLYIADENGSVYHYITPHKNIDSVIKPLYTFLQSCQLRQQTHASYSNHAIDSPIDQTKDITIYVLSSNSHSSFQGPSPKSYIRNTYTLNDIHDQPIFSIQAIAEKHSDGRILFNLYCDYQEFSALVYGDDVYLKTAQFILDKRGRNANYPCYITDLDLSKAIESPASTGIQTVQYLEYKALLEKRLSQALASAIPG